MTGNLRPSPALHAARRFWADESGASLVEFALVITLFLFLLLAIIDFGRIGHAWVSANKATQLAARLAAVRPPVCDGVPTTNVRGLNTTPAFGALCRAGSGVCRAPTPAVISCPGVATSATAQEIFTAIRPLIPASTTVDHLRYSYAFDANLGFLGGPYVPMVTVELFGPPNPPPGEPPGVPFVFISQLRFFVTALTGQSSDLGNEITMPGMSVSLPGEDLNLGTGG